MFIPIFHEKRGFSGSHQLAEVLELEDTRPGASQHHAAPCRPSGKHQGGAPGSLQNYTARLNFRDHFMNQRKKEAEKVKENGQRLNSVFNTVLMICTWSIEEAGRLHLSPRGDRAAARNQPQTWYDNVASSLLCTATGKGPCR